MKTVYRIWNLIICIYLNKNIINAADMAEW